MTDKLAQRRQMLSPKLPRRQSPLMGAADMVELDCPWCEETLVVPIDQPRDEETCPECLTTWSYVTTDANEVALAA